MQLCNCVYVDTRRVALCRLSNICHAAGQPSNYHIAQIVRKRYTYMATQMVTHTFCYALNDILLYIGRPCHVFAKLFVSPMTWKKLLSLQHTPKLLPDQNWFFKLLCSLGHELGGGSKTVVHCRVCTETISMSAHILQ